MGAEQKRERPERSFWYVFARMLSFVLMPIFFPVRYHNKQMANRQDAPYILVSNHVSMLDPIILALPIKRYEIRYLGKRELVKNKLFAYILRGLHMIPLSRHKSDMAAMRASNEVLRQNKVLGIFPEGTRTPPEDLFKGAESGFALIALRNKVPLLPVYIHGRPGMFRITHIHYLPPLSYDHIAAKGVGKDACDELLALLQDTLWEARHRAQAEDIAKGRKKR